MQWELDHVFLATPEPVIAEATPFGLCFRPVDALPWFVDNGLVSHASSGAHVLECVWDHGREGRSQDFADTLPLVVRW